MYTPYYLALDQGTTGTTAILFNRNWREVAKGYCEIPVIYPRAGWVEHDPDDVWNSVLTATRQALQNVGAEASAIRCIGLDHEGESVVVWNRETGRPIYNAIVWQDRRTARAADEMAYEYNDLVREKTGLMIDSYFSATKYQWILTHVDGAQELMRQGKLLAGTLDSYIIWKMTNGAAHITDTSTASRTMLFNLAQNRWDDTLLELFGLQREMLPAVCDSAVRYCTTDPRVFFGVSVPISAILVDQQAALVGNGCIDPGSIKVTYGTGCFMLLNTGGATVTSEHGLLPTIAWRLMGKTTYALDGGVYTTGAATTWLQRNLGIMTTPGESDALASSVESNGGVYFVPAFTGLAAPYWDSYASGMIIGLNGAVGKNHLIRAALESTAYQVWDILDAMVKDARFPITALRCNGGPQANRFLMQFQADILGLPLEIPHVPHTTAFGSAFMGALGIGDFDSIHDIANYWAIAQRYEPKMSADQRGSLLYHWHRAVERAQYWVE